MNNSIKWISLIIITFIICYNLYEISTNYFNYKASYYVHQKQIDSIKHSIQSHNTRLMQLEQKELVQKSYKNPIKK